MSDYLLDDEQDELLNASSEDILWEGAASSLAFAIAGRITTYHQVVLHLSAIPVFFNIYKQNSIIIHILILVIALFLLFLPAMVRRYREKLYPSKGKYSTTHYYILKKGIYIREVNWVLQFNNHFIPFKQIQRIEVGNQKKQLGDITIFTETPASFSTYNYEKNQVQFPPTLNRIQEVKKVAQIIQQNIETI